MGSVGSQALELRPEVSYILVLQFSGLECRLDDVMLSFLALQFADGQMGRFLGPCNHMVQLHSAPSYTRLLSSLSCM